MTKIYNAYIQEAIKSIMITVINNDELNTNRKNSFRECALSSQQYAQTMMDNLGTKLKHTSDYKVYRKLFLKSQRRIDAYDFLVNMSDEDSFRYNGALYFELIYALKSELFNLTNKSFWTAREIREVL